MYSAMSGWQVIPSRSTMECRPPFLVPFRATCLVQLGSKKTNKKKRIRSNTIATPKLKATPPVKVALLVEPTPFTHISGYSNRFREMLK